MEREQFLKFLESSKDAVIINLSNCFGQENQLLVELFQVDKAPTEDARLRGNIAKMGNINFVAFNKKTLMIATSAQNTIVEDLVYIVNAYYAFQPNEGDDNALKLCRTKIEIIFQNKDIYTMNNGKLFKGFSLLEKDLVS
jgi:hypothetical protein